MKYLKAFNTHDDYLTYIVGSEFKNLKYDSVSYCIQQNNVHFDKYVETRLVTKYNVTSTSEPTVLRTNYEQNIFKSMEIDGVMLDELVTEYTFDTIGEHTVKYELYDETKLGNDMPMFGICNLIECIIPDTVTSIGKFALNGCKDLTSIIIGNNITSIADSAFSNCTSLTSVIIGNSVTSIGNWVFYKCSSLTSIVSKATIAPTIQSGTFESVKTNSTLTVPSGSTGYDIWMQNTNYYLGMYNWTKVEQ